MSYQVGYAPEVQALLDQGWVLRCGHCRRRLASEFAPAHHKVYSDLSGKCYLEPEEWNLAAATVTNFFADPTESMVRSG